MSNVNKLRFSVVPRGKPFKGLPSEVVLTTGANTAQIYTLLAAQTKADVNRIRVTKGSDGSALPNDPTKMAEDYGLMDGSQLVVKDLGPQLGWRFVYIVEYFGPLFIHPLMYQLQPYIYKHPSLRGAVLDFPPPSDLQKLALGLIVAHYLKRELETIFVHRFSNATMPFRNIFKNCFHYWLLSGLFLGYFIYDPLGPTATNTIHNPLALAGAALWLFGELGNLNTHLVLKNLRASGTRERGIPRGFGFGAVTCPNYMFEIIAWVGMCLITRSWSTVVFSVVGAGQMAIWAKGKEKRYRKEFGDRYKKKKFVVLPGIY